MQFLRKTLVGTPSRFNYSKALRQTNLTEDNMRKLYKLGMIATILTSFTLLTSCSAIETAIDHRDLDIESKMSQSIFLQPVTPDHKIIYVSVRNTSQEQNLGLKQQIISNLRSKGWHITNNYTHAYTMLQVNVLQAGKMRNEHSVLSSLSNGFGGAVVGAAIGDAMDGGDGAVGGAAAGGAAGFIGGMFVKDVTYAVITDIQVSQKVPKGSHVSDETRAGLAQGSSTYETQSYHAKTNWLKYRTRVVSYADQVNLAFKDAKPKLVNTMATEIDGLF